MSTFKEIAIKEIKANPYQPRNIFDEKDIEQLAQSIETNGLIQPITVRETYTGYELIAGERRYRACILLGKETIMARVIKATEVQSAQLSLIENIQRTDLSCIEQANGYLQVLRLTGMSQQQLASQTGTTQSNIANKLRLLNLNEEVVKALDAKQISERHGRALLALEPQDQPTALKQIITKEMTVQQAENYIANIVAPKKKNTTRCFGVSTKLVINTLKEAYRSIRSLTTDTTLSESEDEENYIMTFTIKK